MADFVKVAAAADIPAGEMVIVEMEGEEIVVANLGGGDLVAFQNECPHRGGPLGEGLLTEGVVECPFHAGRFDVHTGEVLAPPPTDGIRVYAVQVEDGAVKVAKR